MDLFGQNQIQLIVFYDYPFIILPFHPVTKAMQTIYNNPHMLALLQQHAIDAAQKIS